MEQHQYQVRFDWAAQGAHAIGDDADVIVWVDAIAEPGDELDLTALPEGATVLLANLPFAHAIAEWILKRQETVGKRLVIAVVSAGGQRDGHLRVTAEDMLTAGAIIDRLSALGLDATSPEAATAEAAYRGLARATTHLFTAVTTARTVHADPASLRIDPNLSADDVQPVRE